MIDPELWAHVLAEHERQQKKHGPQDYRPGTGDDKLWALCQNVKELVGAKDDLGTTTWSEVLIEEVLEVVSETDPGNLKAELIQVATVCLAWASKIKGQPERRYPDPVEPPKRKRQTERGHGWPTGKPL